MPSALAHFQPIGPFHADLKRRVAGYFDARGAQRPQGGSTLGGPAMLLKTALLFAWMIGSYLALMLLPLSWWQAALLVSSLGLAQAGIGFNVLHDANHGSFSASARLNRIVGWVACDLLGASSHNWRQRHNVLHHTYTNIEGMDDDLEAGPLLRFAPWQPRRPLHRFQHLYFWVLYALFPLRWFFVDDFKELLGGTIGGRPFARPRGAALFRLLLGKALYYTWAFVLPLVFHPGWHLLGLWLLGSAVLGNVLAMVFNLAHCAGEAEYRLASEGRAVPAEWAEHQVATTIDFARGNRFLTWYLGGLNYQVEHHLFPRVCHLHYPALSRIVEETCRAHGLRYRVQPTLLSALAANLRWMRALGAGEERAFPAPAVLATVA
jgi:linoleoyl-CoA desaturase